MIGSGRGRREVLTLVAAAALVLAAVPSLLAHSLLSSPSAPPRPVNAAATHDATRVELVPGASEARYRAQEVLVGRGVNEAVGRTRDVSGAVALAPSGTVLGEQSRISVDLRTLQSDERMRDSYAQRMTLHTDRYPTADFIVGAAPDLPVPIPTAGEAVFRLLGDLTIHGVTRPATWQINATFADGEVVGTAVTDIHFTDFGMEPPRAGPVLSIEDALRLEIEFRAAITPAMSLGQ